MLSSGEAHPSEASLSSEEESNSYRARFCAFTVRPACEEKFSPAACSSLLIHAWLACCKSYSTPAMHAKVCYQCSTVCFSMHLAHDILCSNTKCQHSQKCQH